MPRGSGGASSLAHHTDVTLRVGQPPRRGHTAGHGPRPASPGEREGRGTCLPTLCLPFAPHKGGEWRQPPLAQVCQVLRAGDKVGEAGREGHSMGTQP